MTPSPTISLAGASVITDPRGINNLMMYVVSATVQWLYHHDEDAFVQIPSGALAGVFGAGTCGTIARWSNTVTANGGSTTTATTAATITGLCIGRVVRFLTGANIGTDATITGAIIVTGGTSTIQFGALTSAVANTDTFVVDTGTAYVQNAGTIAVGSFKSYDFLTAVWTSLSITNLPAAWATDGQMVATPSGAAHASGTATSGSTTTLVNLAKNWGINQWCNYRLRITAGTGKGQLSSITTNTATTLTIPAGAVVDMTSQYVIESNDDFLYLLGNAAVAMYRFTRSTNTWAVLAPTTVRGGITGVALTADFVGVTGDANWALETAIQDGRYIYSMRGGGLATLDRFDISGGTAGAGAWTNITYPGQAETFNTGSASAWAGRFIYLRKDGTNRFFKFNVRGGYMEPLSTSLYPESTVVTGKKVWVKDYDGTGVILWLYSLRNSGSEMHRLPLF